MTDNKNFENEAVELNDKKLEKVAGGVVSWTCPKCGATTVTRGSSGHFGGSMHYCSNCGYTEDPQDTPSAEESARLAAEQILGILQK